MTKLDVAVFGEAMAMFIADAYGPLERADHYTRDVAGAELNVAVGLSRLGYHVGWMSRLGADPFGRYILRQVGQAGVDTSRVIFDDQRPTGFQLPRFSSKNLGFDLAAGAGGSQPANHGLWDARA